MFQCIHTFPNWSEIQQDLQALAQQKLSPEEIINTLIKFKHYSHVARYKVKEHNLTHKLPALYNQYKQKLPNIYSKIARFILDRHKFELPLLRSKDEKEQVYTKEQLLYLFSTMMLCLIPKQEFDDSQKQKSRFSSTMDFSYIFEEEDYKTVAAVEYIDSQIENTESYFQQFVIKRQIENKNIEQIIEENKDQLMLPISMENDQASIEDYFGQLKTDFANKFLGGGALTYGCVQEELMFVNHPELWTTQLLCEVMEPNEAILLRGFKKYFKNTGYGHTAAFGGLEKHNYSFTNNKIANEYITAIDAVCYAYYGASRQFGKEDIKRELLKAYVGFNIQDHNLPSVVTGNWGCGAFAGDLRLKFLIQWLACSLAKKKMIYCPFGNRNIIYSQAIIDKFEGLKIGQAYLNILRAAELVMDTKQQDIYSKLLL